VPILIGRDAPRKEASTTMSDTIWDNDGRQLAWIANEGGVFSVATKQKVATVRGWELFSLQGEPLNLRLQGAGLVRGEGDSTPAAFMKLLAS